MIQYFEPSKNTLFLDMDGVVADFDRLVLEKMRRTFDHVAGPAGDTEMWDFLSTVDRLYFRLEPTPYAFDLWELANKQAANVEFLTAIPRRTFIASAETDKREWIAKYFGVEAKVRIGPYSADKWKHAQAGDILVDDRSDNIQAWINRGSGIGIYHEYDKYEYTASRIIAMTTEHERFK